MKFKKLIILMLKIYHQIKIILVDEEDLRVVVERYIHFDTLQFLIECRRKHKQQHIE